MSKLSSHPFGKPISILNFQDSKIVVNNDEFSEIFSHPDIQDRKIVIFSLIGAFRGGKSYLLDYCLRFLYAHYPSIRSPDKTKKPLIEINDDWMGNADEPLTGFSWKSGTKRDTTGILVWNDIFLHTSLSTGENLAIFVMDTQGLFDSESTPADNSRIFSLGTLMSSIQVLNTMNRIREDELQYLQFVTELTQFSSRTIKHIDGKSFQNLIFLVRDWNNEDEFGYGVKGGEEYINEILKIKPNQKSELKLVRETVRDSFENIQCCLLPHPGKTVARTKDHDGRWSEMDDEFKQELKAFIEHLLMPDNLIIKKVNYVDVTVSQMYQLTKDYFQLFSSNQAPKTSSIHDLTVENYMNNFVKKLIKKYKLSVFQNADLITKDNIPKFKEICLERILELYKNENKMGSADIHMKYEAKLLDEINEFNDIIQTHTTNDEKLSKLEKELKILQEDLEKQAQQKSNAEHSLKSIQEEMEQLKEKMDEMDPEAYKKQSLMFEAYKHIEQQKLDKINIQQNEEQKFRNALSIALGIGAVVAAVAVVAFVDSSKVLLLLNKIKELAYYTSETSKAIDMAYTDVRHVTNSLSMVQSNHPIPFSASF